MPATMSERRSYNFRPRKEVSYSEDQQQKDEVLDNEMPKRKGKAKKNTTPKKSAKAKPSKSSKRKKPIEDESKNKDSFYSSGESSDELKSPNKDQNQSKYQDEELHNSYTPTETHSLSTNNVSFAGVRKRLHGESTLDRTHLDQPDLERSELPEGEVYSGDDEPDSTMPDFVHGFEPNFGTISPIKDEYTSKEKRDKLTSGVGRELRPIPKRKRHQSKEEVMEAFQKSVKRQILVSVLGLVIISALAVAAILTFEDVKSSVPSTRRSRLKSNLEKLKVQFPSQSDRLWNVLGGASLSHIMDPPILERPVVVLLAGTSESVTTMRCLATKVAAMFDDVFQSSRNPIVIKGNTYIEMNSDQAKMKIDQDLKTGFEAHSRSAIVHNLDYLPPCSILLFHSYCENDNAPYKDVAIILTVHLGIEDVDLEDMKSREFDQAVGDHLKIRWDDCPQELTPDKQDAMLSRVGNNIARVKSEDRIVVREVCY